MKCPMCGWQFREEDAKTACDGCPIGGSCGMIKCPNCNYEMPAEPKLIKALRVWKERNIGTGRKS
ncbi:MAG: hypothetical protein A2Z28_00880 [Chloroflexi bacterium RBG_16_51_9]|nr:MAG: hypothetical protein A2Z28_00880 [Chloroflexi bacterium RBG_16_51_9]